MTGEVGDASEKGLNGPPPVGQRLPIHPNRPLPPSHRRIAAAKSHQGLGRGVVKEHIHLVGRQHLCHQLGGLIKGGSHLGRWQFQQPFQGG
jgi:hypothetical protein